MSSELPLLVRQVSLLCLQHMQLVNEQMQLDSDLIQFGALQRERERFMARNPPPSPELYRHLELESLFVAACIEQIALRNAYIRLALPQLMAEIECLKLQLSVSLALEEKAYS